MTAGEASGRVFVKLLPLSERERREPRSTRNLFGLPAHWRAALRELCAGAHHRSASLSEPALAYLRARERRVLALGETYRRLHDDPTGSPQA